MIETHYVGEDLLPVEKSPCGCSDELGRMVYDLTEWFQKWLHQPQDPKAAGLVCQARKVVERHIQNVTWKDLPK